MVLSYPAEKPLPCAFRQYQCIISKAGLSGPFTKNLNFFAFYPICIYSIARRARFLTPRSFIGNFIPI